MTMTSDDGPRLDASLAAAIVRAAMPDDARAELLELVRQALPAEGLELSKDNADRVMFAFLRKDERPASRVRSALLELVTGALVPSFYVLTRTIAGTKPESEGKHFAELATDTASVTALAKELELALAELAEGMPTELDALEGALAHDAHFASYLGRYGEEAERLAKKVRRESIERTESNLEVIAWEREARAAEATAHDFTRWDGYERFVARATELQRAHTVSRDFDAALKADPLFDGLRAQVHRAQQESERRLAELGPRPEGLTEAELLADWLPAATGLAELERVIPRNVFRLARVLWRDVVGPRLAEERRRPAALVRTVHASVIGMYSRGNKFDPRSKTLTFDGHELAKVTEASFDLQILERGLDALRGSVAAHRLFEWEVKTGHERYLCGEAYPNVLDVEGGWTALAKRLGLDPNKAVPSLRAMVYAQAHFRFRFPDGSEGNMLSYTERAAAGRNERARVTITLGAPLLPGYVQSLARGAERKLVPLLREALPLYGRPNEHGAQLTMSLALMAELRARATELYQRGGARLTHDDFTRMADRSGVARRLIVPVRDLWLRGDTRALPVLKVIEADRYTLHDARAAERAFLEEGGKQEAQGSAAGKKGTARKRGKIARLARK